jgi:hypothetical protein
MSTPYNADTCTESQNGYLLTKLLSDNVRILLENLMKLCSLVLLSAYQFLLKIDLYQ